MTSRARPVSQQGEVGTVLRPRPSGQHLTLLTLLLLLIAASPARMRQIRGDRISMIFQEPMTALNPLMTVGRQVDELLRIHRRMPQGERWKRIYELFKSVLLRDPERIYDSYPHQLSGGQRQRAVIAMALILEPDVVIADEPTTALDVTTQAQILKLIKDLQAVHLTAFMFITHDFGVVAEIADRVAVMQHGRVVETSTTANILDHPKHAYTRTLLDAVPRLVPRAKRELKDAEDLLAVRGLFKSFGARRRLFRRRRRPEGLHSRSHREGTGQVIRQGASRVRIFPITANFLNFFG
jgi:peptide/nickel transport system ATP-binding protein